MRAALVTALAITCSVLGPSIGLVGHAGAAVPALSPAGVELPMSLPGFKAAPAGVFNGPVSTATLITYSTDPDVLSEIENGSVSAYLRDWSHPYPGGDGILSDLVVEFPYPSEATDFLAGLKSTLGGLSAVGTFAVKSPSGAEGYTAHGVIVPGSTDIAIALGRGDFAAFIMSATPAGNLSTSQVELVAAAQWAALPGLARASTVPVSLPTKLPALLPAADLSSSASGGVEALLVVVVVVVALVALVLWALDFIGRRRRGGPASGDLGPGEGEGLAEGEALDEAPAAGEGVGA